VSERASRLAVAALVLALAACGGDRPAEGADRPAAPAPSASLQANLPVDTTPAPARVDSGLVAHVQRDADGGLVVTGSVGVDWTLELSVEDGRRVLYGPTPVDVENGRFQAEFVAERSDQPALSLYVTTTDGARQWVIPIPADQIDARSGS